MGKIILDPLELLGEAVRRSTMDTRSKRDAGSFLGGHLSYDQIEKYSRDPHNDSHLHDSIANHLSECRRCQLTYEDITNLDPYLCQGEPLPDNFWENIWKSIA